MGDAGTSPTSTSPSSSSKSPSAPLRHQSLGLDSDQRRRAHERKSTRVYLLILVAFLAVQFGHGSNIGVAVSLPGEHKAVSLALGSWVMVGVSLGLPLTPWACRTFGYFQTCSTCVVIDTVIILLMLWPGIGMRQIYVVRLLVGFFEAPFLPYLQEWLACFGTHTWNIWNTILHGMVPVGENLGYIIAQELVAAGYPWQYAFAGQAIALIASVGLLYVYGGRRYLDVSCGKTQTYVDEGVIPCNSSECPEVDEKGGSDYGGRESEEMHLVGEVEYPVTERWCVYWATNASLASQLGFLSGTKYVIRDYAMSHGFSLHFVIFAFSAIALLAPALGSGIVMSGTLIRPDQWSQHRRTLVFLSTTSMVAACLAALLPYTPEFAFWPALFTVFVFSGGIYPAAQGIINITLTATRVIEASVYQVQCNNLLFAMPLPYVVGKIMDVWSVDASFRIVTLLQVLAALGFAAALMAATITEERNTWHRLLPAPRQNSEASPTGSNDSRAVE